MNSKKSVKIFIVLTIVLLLSSMANASFLDDEAGISAYSTVSSVDIAAAATAFKNIEYQTSEYIIGSVAIPDYNEIDDVHVYLHTSGEIIAYYLRDIHLCHMIDWKAYHNTKQITGSKLHTALEIIADAMSASLSEIKLYDFRYPDAPNIKIIVDEARKSTDTFRYQIPGTYTVHEAFWSHFLVDCGSYCSASSTLKIDDIDVDITSGAVWRYNHGTLSSEYLTPDVYHTASLTNSGDANSYFAIVLLYSEPQ